MAKAVDPVAAANDAAGAVEEVRAAGREVVAVAVAARGIALNKTQGQPQSLTQRV